ncbi:MAG: tetratricopeptide repeat protein [Flavobacteriales bacterium]|nr:tetratricopeptide repeat protein [Flavobacteriales bacterium]
MTRSIIFTPILLFILINMGHACTMYKVTLDGKTIVGNNEDFLTPNTQIWFENSDEHKYAVMYVGFYDMAQGAINEAGLIVDGFSTNWLPVENTKGKIEMDLDNAFLTAMRTMSHVEQVKEYYDQINLSAMSANQLVFVDRTGTYLIIEGDEMIIGEESEMTFSNFYYSQIKSLQDVQLPYYQNGLSFLDATETKLSMDYCIQVMDKMCQADIAATQYSTIYDLVEMKVRIYYYHDFTIYIELDLHKEFEKADYGLKMAEWFPDDSPGKKFYAKYNDPDNPCGFIKEILGEETYSEEQLTNAGIGFFISMVGFEWQNNMKNLSVAQQVFQYGLELMPNNANLHSNLGKAYFEEGNYTDSKACFEKAIAMDKENEEAKDYLERIQEMKEGK